MQPLHALIDYAQFKLPDQVRAHGFARPHRASV